MLHNLFMDRYMLMNGKLIALLWQHFSLFIFLRDRDIYGEERGVFFVLPSNFGLCFIWL